MSKYTQKKGVPLTSREQYQRTRKEINATNKRRAADMERRVAKYLSGDRTPASGAMSKYKGDVKVPLSRNKHFLIECKMSAARDSYGNPEIAMQSAWFPKNKKDAKAMGSVFSVLIIHHHGLSGDYVFVPLEALQWIGDRTSYAEVVSDMCSLPVAMDYSVKPNGSYRAMFKLQRKHIEQHMQPVSGMRATKFKLVDGDYVIMSLEHFRDIIEDI
jgi:hypothetical protein